MTPRNNRPVSSHRPAAVPIHRGPQAISPAATRTLQPAAVSHRAQRRPAHRLRQRHDGHPLRPRPRAPLPARLRASSRARSPCSAPTPTGAAIRSTSSPSPSASIDMIMAPAYGSSKKNATDIRLAIDAMELVFNRPEIGTYILLSGDSDFSSLVMKLKEYGKYVIGVGIRESSSDLLVQNCDEYYSYNALAGLVKTNEEENVKRDPWELVVEAAHAHEAQRRRDALRSPQAGDAGDRLDVRREGSRHGEVLAIRAGSGAARPHSASRSSRTARWRSTWPETARRPRRARRCVGRAPHRARGRARAAATAEERAARRGRRRDVVDVAAAAIASRAPRRTTPPRDNGRGNALLALARGTRHRTPCPRRSRARPSRRWPASGSRATRRSRSSAARWSSLTTSEDHPVPASAVRARRASFWVATARRSTSASSCAFSATRTTRT